VAGDGTACARPPGCGNGRAAVLATLTLPSAVAVGRAGKLLIADTGDNEIRQVGRTGVITAIAGAGGACGAPHGCGPPSGPAHLKLAAPGGVAVDGHGNVYVSDTGGHRVLIVSPAGASAPLAGNGLACAAPPRCGSVLDPAAARLSLPSGLALDPAGDLYLADTTDQEIRLLPPARTPLASLGSAAGPVAMAELGLAVAHRSLTVRYALSAAAVVALSLVGPHRKLRRLVRVFGEDGAGELRWDGRLGHKRLPVRRYQLLLSLVAGPRTASIVLSVVI